MNKSFLNSTQLFSKLNFCLSKPGRIKKLIRTVLLIPTLWINPTIALAAPGDQIISVIKDITQDIYMDFVYLSLGFATTVCIYHLIIIIFNSGDDQTRNKHVKAISTALLAWVLINIFALCIAKIFNLTGQFTPADIFSTGGFF